MAYSYGDFGKWELDEEEGILACSIFWADVNANLHLAILLVNRTEFLLHVDKYDDNNMVVLFPEARAISHCTIISVVDEKSVLVNFSGHNLVFKKDQYEMISGVLTAFGVDAKSTEQIPSDDINIMSGVDFEKLILQLVHKMGFDAETTKKSGDGGIDIVAYNNQPFLEGKYIIQCKRWGSSVGEPILRDLYGVVMSERANKGILVTTSNFTSSAIAFADGKPLEMIDGNKLRYLLDKYSIVSKASDVNMLDLSEWLDASTYDNYLILINELSMNRSNYDVRYKVICIIMNRIMNNIYCNYEASSDEMDSIIAECRKHLSVLESSQQTSKHVLGLQYVSYFFDAQLSIIQGNFINALKCFQKILDWSSIRYTCPIGTVGNGKYRYAEELLAIMINITQIYSALGLHNKARSFSSMHEKVLMEVSEETIWYPSIDDIDNVTICDNNNEVEFDKTTANIINKARNCTIDCFLFWDNDYYNSDCYIYNIRSDVYIFNIRTQYHLKYNEDKVPVGIVGYPQWSDKVIQGMEEVKKRINLLL